MTVISLLVQTLVWTSLGGGLYLLWMMAHETSPLALFYRTHHVTRVVRALLDLWMIIGVSLIIMLLISGLVPLLDRNNDLPASCITLPAQFASVREMDYSTAMICAPTDSVPEEPHPS